jgi:hypothetical protein
MHGESREIGQFCEDMSVAGLRGAPATEHLALEFWKLCHECIVLKQVFFELLNAALATELGDFEGVGPF